MKTIFLAAAAVVAIGGIASAADLPVKAAAPIVRPACAQFGGIYVGGNVGYGTYNYNYHDNGNLVQTIDDDLTTSARLTTDGWTGGVQLGYNWQPGCALFGLEADWSWTNIKANQTFFDGDGGTQDALTLESKMRWFGTLRARTGIVMDNLLLYVTGGFAYADFNRSYAVFEDAPITTAIFGASHTRFGWTAGIGTEWAWTSNWSFKGEVLYMAFADDQQNFVGQTINGVNFGVPGRSYSFSNQDDAWVARIGVNYRFR